MFVLTIDQRDSRRSADLVEGLLTRMATITPEPVLGFERTAGDEVQGVLSDPMSVVALILDLVRTQQWSIGVGVGPVRRPLPTSTRAGAGPAFESARQAVDRAKTAPGRLAVIGDRPDAAQAQAVLRLVAALVDRRSDAGWQAIDAMTGGTTQFAAATQLGISPQAASQRLAAAARPQEVEARPVAAALLGAADTGGAADT